MSYTHDLAEILSDVTNASYFDVNTIEDGIRAYMIEYVRRGCSMRTVFTSYVDLIRFAQDVAQANNNNQPMPVERVTSHVIEAHLARLAAGLEIKCTKQPSVQTVERRRRIVKVFLRWLVSEEYLDRDPTKKLSPIPLRKRFPSVWSLQEVRWFFLHLIRQLYWGIEISPSNRIRCAIKWSTCWRNCAATPNRCEFTRENLVRER